MKVKKINKLTDLYDTMKLSFTDDLIKGAVKWELNHKYDFVNAPASVQFVKMMAVMEQPIGIETYERALKEGPEWFPDEIEHRRKWVLVPQEVKNAYSADPNSEWAFLDPDSDAPDIIKNWPGILAATDEDWKIRGEWYSSDKYKEKQLRRNILRMETYNKYFSKYGLTKTIEDYL